MSNPRGQGTPTQEEVREREREEQERKEEEEKEKNRLPARIEAEDILASRVFDDESESPEAGQNADRADGQDAE